MRATALLFAATLSCFTVLPSYATANDSIAVGFTPAQAGEPSAEALVISAIAQAKYQILVVAYSFTSKPIAQALMGAKTRGVDVRVVADQKANSGKYTAVTFLANNGVPVRLNGRFAITHDKSLTIDGSTVETGSFNFTSAAAHKNSENAVVLRNVPELAGKYAQKFEMLWNGGQDLAPAY